MAYPQQMVRALNAIADAARHGLPCPSNSALAATCDMNDGDITPMLDTMARRGMIRIERLTTGTMVPIRIVSAPDGAWRTAAERALWHSSSAPGRGLARGALSQERKCLTCRQPFQPRHKHNFRCCGEGHANGRSA